MPVYRQKWIMRADLKNNPDTIYIFGDNTERVGLGGQAKEMRGEPNAIGVATKWAPASDDAAFFSDDRFSEICLILDEDMEPVFTAALAGKTIVVPADGLGTGLSELPQRAPKCNRYLEALLDRILNMK